MKSQKSNSKSKRNRYRVSRNQRTKSPKMGSSDCNATSDDTKAEAKVMSGSWKRKPLRQNSSSDGLLLKTNEEKASPSSSRFQPGKLYSDVLFSGENSSTLVKIRSLTPDKVASQLQIFKSRSKSRKRTAPLCPSDQKKDYKDIYLTNCTGNDRPNQEKKEFEETTAMSPKNSNDLTECTEHLMKRLNIEIPSWNFTKFGTFNDMPRFVCQFDDYNYLACEKLAFVGLKLASDGKFKS